MKGSDCESTLPVLPVAVPVACSANPEPYVRSFTYRPQVSRQGDASSLPLEHRGGSGGLYGPPPPPQDLYGPPANHLAGNGLPPDEPWPLAAPDMPQIKHLQVQCEKTHMRVNIEFDRPFYGMIFSKGLSDLHT